MKLDVIDCENCGGHHLICNDVTVVTSRSKGVCLRMARILEQASNRPAREAIKLMYDEIGFEEHIALDILSVMFGEVERPRTLQ